MQSRPRRRGYVLSALAGLLAITQSSVAETWSYDLTTTGSDVVFLAPVALDPQLPGYKMVYHVEMMNATAILPELPGWPLTVEVLDRLPPELRDGVKYLAGPPPLVLLEDDAYYPDDIEDPNLAGFRCHIRFGMNDDGRAYVSATDTILSILDTQIDPNDPSSPTITIQLLSVQLIGTISAEPAPAVQLSTASAPTPEGGSASVTAKLSMAPAADVLVTITRAEGDADLTCDTQSLTFTPSNWNTPQTSVFSAAVDDDGEAGQATFDFTADAAAPARLTVVEIEPDCDHNGVADRQEILSGAKADCNGNELPDACEITAGTRDCNNNGVPDTCELSSGSAGDCDGNGELDSCDIAGGAADCNADGIPDRCQADRDRDGAIDACDQCPDDPSKRVPGQCGCGVAESNCGGSSQNSGDQNSEPNAPTPDGGADANSPGGTGSGDAGSSPDDSAAEPNDPGGASPTTSESEPGINELDRLFTDICGTGACGVGTFGWMPAVFLGLVGLRGATRRVR